VPAKTMLQSGQNGRQPIEEKVVNTYIWKYCLTKSSTVNVMVFFLRQEPEIDPFASLVDILMAESSFAYARIPVIYPC